MDGNDFRAWRERMGFNRMQAAEALGLGRNQPKRYEEMGDEELPEYIALACRALEGGGHPEQRDLTRDEIANDVAATLRKLPPDVRLKEIVAVTMLDGANRPFPSIVRYYVEWFNSNGLRELPDEIRDRLMQGLRAAIIAEARKMESSEIGRADTIQHFERLELLGIFTTDRAKALLDCWANPIDLRRYFFPS